ncbi:MAG TPA: HEAT repeat domain-containing protein, partial [Blastocatellia bacterium]
MKLVFAFCAAIVVTTASTSICAQDGRQGEAIVRANTEERAKRQEMLSVLGALKDPANQEKARKALADQDWYLRGQAAVALARANKASAADLLPLLEDKNWFVRGSALDALALLGDKSVGPNVLPLLDPADPYICARASAILGEIGFAPAAEPLLKLLASDDEQIKRAAAEALGALKAQAAEDSLIGLLKDDSFAVRTASARALGAMGDSKAAAPVEAAFEDAVKRDAPDSWEYAVALYRLGNHDHIDMVISALKSTFPDTRAGALQALTEFGDNRATSALTDLAHPGGDSAGSSGADVAGEPFRLHLVTALARINDGKARAGLIGMFDDPDPEVRAAAVTGLAASLSGPNQQSASSLDVD